MRVVVARSTRGGWTPERAHGGERERHRARSSRALARARCDVEARNDARGGWVVGGRRARGRRETRCRDVDELTECAKTAWYIIDYTYDNPPRASSRGCFELDG